MIDDVLITPLNIIETLGGSVMHAIKKSDIGFVDFGEAYFSNVEFEAIKAWKRHRQMTLNLVVPIGIVKFVLFDDRDIENPQFYELILSKDNYFRITIPPMIWVGFQGLAETDSILLNIANIEHNPQDVDRKNIEQINYDWRIIL